MALGFIKKVFSFGRKEVEERPAEDEPLAPLNFEALKAFTREAAAPSPLEGEGPAKRVEGAVDEVPDLLPLTGRDVGAKVADTPDVAPIDVSSAPSTADAPPSGVAGHPPLEGGEDAEPSASPTSSLEEEMVGEADQGGVADEARDAPDAPIAAGTRETRPATPPSAPVPSSPPQVASPLETPPSPSFPAGPSPREERGEGGSSNADAPLSPSSWGEGKAEGQRFPSDGSSPPIKVTVARSVEKAAPAAPQPAPEPRKTWFQRLREGLSRSSRELTGSIAGIFTRRKLDEETLEELEDVLIRADLGMETALRITDTLASSRYGKDVSDTEVRAIMAQEVEKVLTPVARALELDLSHKPHVILVVGVNGTGKTTTIGKLAAKLTAGGLSVMLAAGDTFRAAAIEQLKIWGERTNSPVVSSKLGADAAGLAWDAFERAKEAGSDVLIIDTAGRLQNKAELMAELEKIVRVLGKHDPEAPHTVLQTVDATTGQNALNQVEIFRNVAGVNGLVMTKLDGTARGGILVAIAAKHKLPVYFIGVGEQVDDLEPFSASDFAKAIAGVG